MKELSSLPDESWPKIKVVLTDIDDTLTTNGKLTAQTYNALEALSDAGIIVIPVTGRCAGWCDHFARMWPINAIVGENGAFYFRYDHDTKTMHQNYCQDATERSKNNEKLQSICQTILAEVPGTAFASDQPYRSTDFAIDFAEDVPRLPADAIQKISDMAHRAGATAKISSIHVNMWFGRHSKLSTSMTLLEECFGMSADDVQEAVVFVGDSPNDASMFGYFDLSIGVANILETLEHSFDRPSYVAEGIGGMGFSEVARYLLDAKSSVAGSGDASLQDAL